jgi:ATP-dependent helicase/nuclease subunit B
MGKRFSIIPGLFPLSSTTFSMEAFLERVASALLDRHQHELDHVAVVLPGRRAGLHLRRYLARSAGRTIWSPEMLNMGGFMERITGLRQGGSMDMLFMLHEAHRRVRGQHAHTLPEFLQWAPVTLRDMSEVDSHLADLDQLYRDLRNFQEIEDWSFQLDELSPGQQRLAQQWTQTGEMHRCLHRLMEEKRMGTSGWLARTAAASMGALLENGLPWKSVWFVGLNALDPASTKVAKALCDAGLGVMAWDADQFYLEDPRQEAGRFLRRSIRDLGPGVIPPVNELRERIRAIHSVAVPNGAAQASYAAQLLAGLPPEKRQDVAVILAAEDLLMPLLEALPPEAGPFNVTMGMPLRALPVHGLVEAWLDMQNHATPTGAYHYTHVERLLLHPFLHDPRHTADVIAAIRAGQKATLEAGEIEALASAARMAVPEKMSMALQPVQGDVSRLQQQIPALIAWALETVGADELSREQLYLMARLQQRLDRDLAASGGQAIDIRSYILLRTRLLNEENIGFFGEPLTGIQIMGFLETRSLDHEHVIVLGANDGTLPAGGRLQSWIPFEIRRSFHLPVPGDSEAITAYHFQRMMHLASEVHLVHDTSGDNGSAGPSRYLEQWRLELAGNSNTTIGDITVSAPFPKRHAPVLSVQKSEAVLERIRAMGAKGFSPSALATWLTCPLDYYFKYILGIRSPEEVDEKLGGDVLGEAVHAVMEDIFKPLLKKEITGTQLKTASQDVERLVHEKLQLHFPSETLRQGTFRLKMEMATRAICSHLQAEAMRCDTESTMPLELESLVSAELPNGMIIRGRCDRIDLREGVHHILDLKTGSVQPSNVEFRSLDRELIVPDRKFGLQLLMYAWAYMNTHPSVQVARAGIIPMQRSSQAGGLLLKIGGSHDITRAMLPQITDLLGGLVDELLDPAMPFTHTEASAYCTCCTG